MAKNYSHFNYSETNFSVNLSGNENVKKSFETLKNILRVL